LDKLLPTIIGFGISAASGGTIDPMTAAMMVGGVDTARTGDIGRGISAGFGAYGGATLGAGMTSAGSTAMGTEAGALAGNEAATWGASQLTDAGANVYNQAQLDALKRAAIDEGALQQGMSELTGKTTTGELFSKGIDVAKADPMKYLKANAIPLATAFGPAILAGASAKENMPKTTTGMISPYTFDPYSGTYTAGNPYPATPNRAAEGGLMGLAAGGMAGYGDGDDVARRTNDGMAQGGMYDFAQRSEPVVRMASGGIAHFEIGGEVKDAIASAYAAGDYSTVNDLVASNNITAADVANTWQGFDTSGLAGMGINLPDVSAPASTTGGNYYGGDTPSYGGDYYGGSAAQTTQSTALTPMVDTSNVDNRIAEEQTSPSQYTSYTPNQIGQWFADNKNATNEQVQTAIRDSRVDPTAVDAYIASLTSPFVGSTATTGGSGTLGIYNNMVASGTDPTEYHNAAIRNDPKYAGWSLADIQRGYKLDEGAYALTAQIAKDKIAADPKLGYDREWVKFMDTNKYSVNDMAQAFGLSINETQRRYDAVKAAEKVVTPPVVTPPVVTPPITYNTAGTNAPGGLEGMLGLPPGVSGAGITTVNPNGTITTRPNIPGIPEGGFTGMTSLRDAYEKGGGSLGYVPYTPKTIEEFDTKYGSKLTGGSKQSYDFLTGKTKYSPTPYTPTGEVMKPYGESVIGMPINLSKKMYLFDPATKTYKINPDYAIPTRDSKGKVSYALTNKDVTEFMGTNPSEGDFSTWANTNNLSPEQIAAATGLSLSEVYKKLAKGKPKDEVANTPITSQNDASSTGGEANGGLMKLAGGGMSGRFNLGDYSDGGRLLRGPGDGVSDSIPASIGGKRPARLADGEFVVPARIVSELGNGSTEAGARKLYAMMDRIQSARRGTVGKGRVAKNSRSEKYLPA
jgi:hypothetical protein